MPREAIVPCFVCGTVLQNAFEDEGQNQPSGGTEFRTYGHYGSTFWDSFQGEELILNICDDCLGAHTDRLAQQKRYKPVLYDGASGYGREWVAAPIVPYTGHEDDRVLNVEIEELGTALPHVEWSGQLRHLRISHLIEMAFEGFSSSDEKEHHATAEMIRKVFQNWFGEPGPIPTLPKEIEKNG